MQLWYGDYGFPANGCHVATSSRLVKEGSVPFSYTVSVRVSGELIGSGQAELTTLQNEMTAALSVNYQDLIFYGDSAAPTATVLMNSTSISGVQIIEGPDFPGTRGSEYATMREFSFTAEATYLLPNSEIGNTISFRESLEFSGGGPLFVMKRSLIGPPQRQKVYDHTEFVVVQSGEAVGKTDYPRHPAPLWPAALKESPKLVLGGPEPLGGGYWRYSKSWSYVFESASPLVGAPRLWI